MKSLVCLSDIHCGHRIAISPPAFHLKGGGIYTANNVQLALFKAWEELAKLWNAPDVLVINGEPIDGQGAKNRGVEQWTTNYLDQIDAAVELVKMFHPKQVFVTQGSGYHIEQGGVSIEEIFGERVGVKKRNDGFVIPELFLTVDEVKFNFAHHISSSTSGWNYRSTAIAKEMMLGQLNASHKRPFDIMVRSHIHYFWAVESAGKLGIITPVWQLQTAFMQKKGTMGSIPDIGGVRFNIEGADYRWEKKLFKLPEAKPILVKI